MEGKFGVITTLVFSLVLFAGPVEADILNGDFEHVTDLQDWTPYTAVDSANAGQAVVEEVRETGGNDRLHLRALNSYTYTSGEWLCDQAVDSYAEAINLGTAVSSPITKLRFEAEIFIQTLENATEPYANVWLSVDYNDLVDYIDLPFFNSASRQSYDLDLPGFNSGQVFKITVYAESDADTFNFPSGTEGQTTDVIAEAYFDNFQFIPEPFSATLLALGAAVLVGRTRRRIC